MATTTTVYGGQAFVVDQARTEIDQGHVIDWSLVPDSYKNAEGKKVIPAGAVMRYTQDLLGALPAADQTLKIIPADSADVPAYSGAAFFLATNAIEDDPSAAKTGYGVITGATLFENLLPDQAGGLLPSEIKDELEASRLLGLNRGYIWRKYYDSRAA